MKLKENTKESEILDPDTLLCGQSIDCVIIGFKEGELKVLVLKWKGVEKWALPGGFISENEDLDSAAVRILQERTGIKLPYLEQFHTFGNSNRCNEEFYKDEIKALVGDNEAFLEFIQKRFISTCYFSLVDIDKCSLVPDMLSDKCEWKSLSKMPNLIQDHNNMILKALEVIKMQLNYLPVGINLLPSKFCMKELRALYEAILGRELDRGNFQKKILRLDILIRLEKQLNGGAHKAPYLYKFDKKKYKDSLNKGIGFMN